MTRIRSGGKQTAQTRRSSPLRSMTIETPCGGSVVLAPGRQHQHPVRGHDHEYPLLRIGLTQPRL
jgi:hypothetical protein